MDFIWKRDAAIIPIEGKWSEFTAELIPVRLKNFCSNRDDIKTAVIITKSFLGLKKEGNIKYHFILACLFIHWIKAN